MALCGLLLASISGCASVKDALYDGVHDIDCKAVYTQNFGAAYEKRTATIPVTAVRVDKNGTYWVRVRSTLNVRFFPGWKSIDNFSDYQCKGNDYGLRSAAIRR